MNILISIISFIVLVAIIAAAYLLCKKFIFGKVRINKWIILSITMVLFIAQMFIGQTNKYLSIVLSIFAILFFLWFMDITQKVVPKTKKNEKQIVIKPKAKPNRVKKHK